MQRTSAMIDRESEDAQRRGDERRHDGSENGVAGSGHSEACSDAHDAQDTNQRGAKGRGDVGLTSLRGDGSLLSWLSLVKKVLHAQAHVVRKNLRSVTVGAFAGAPVDVWLKGPGLHFVYGDLVFSHGARNKTGAACIRRGEAKAQNFKEARLFSMGITTRSIAPYRQVPNGDSTSIPKLDRSAATPAAKRAESHAGCARGKTSARWPRHGPHRSREDRDPTSLGLRFRAGDDRPSARRQRRRTHAYRCCP